MLQSRSPRRNSGTDRTSAIISISLLVALFVLLGIALMWFAVQQGVGFVPTPTPTPTAQPPATPTPDVRATHVAEDMLTQIAFAATSVGFLTPVVPIDGLPPAEGVSGTPQVQLPLVVVPGATLTPATDLTPGALDAPTVTPFGTSVYMPNVANPGQVTPTAAPAPIVTTGPLVTPALLPPTPLPTPVLPPPPLLPTPIPPSPTPLPLPPTATPLPLVGTELAAVLSTNTVAHLGPSNVYTVTGSLGSGASVRLRGRTVAGDWVYGCCLPNTTQFFWVRRAFVTIANNPLPTGMPEGTDPNDPRWLAVQPLDPILIPRPVPTSIPPGDFPLARYDAQNSGRVPFLPRPLLQQNWLISGQAGQGFASPVAVSGPNVLAGSNDNQFYSLGLDAGNQRWRYSLGTPLRLAPAIQDGLIYLAFGRTMLSIQDQGNAAGIIWQSDLAFDATSAFTPWFDTLFIGAGDGADARLMAIKRGDPNDRREFNEPNARVQQPAIGQETIFVGADRLWALDINLWTAQEIVWVSPDIFNVATAPVYAFPGVARLAELYVADSSGNVHALDASTGTRIWQHAFGAPITALAYNDGSVIMVSNSQVRAVSRQAGQVQWTQAIGAQVMGGPLVAGDRVLLVMANGAITLYDAATGAIVDAAASIAATVPGGPAVSGAWLFVPASNNTVYGFRGAP